jgi:small subunit ribosomal protein S16
MALIIRLRQQGRNNRQTYRVVVVDVHSKRDGKYLEKLGWYNPSEEQNNLFVDAERVRHWLSQGALISDQVQSLVSKAAPEVIKEWKERRCAKRTKNAAKRRALKKAKKAA